MTVYFQNNLFFFKHIYTFILKEKFFKIKMETEALETPTKKTKRSPLQAIKEGENMMYV